MTDGAAPAPPPRAAAALGWRRARSCWASPTRCRPRSSWSSSSSCRCCSWPGCRLSDWPLLQRRPRAQLPRRTTRRHRRNTLFWPAVVFTIEYTVLVTVLLIGLGLGLALLVQEGGRWVGPPAHELPAARRARPGVRVAAVLGLLLAVDRPDQPAARAAGPDRRARSRSSARRSSALLSTIFLIVWKFAGLYMLILLVGLQAIPHEVYEAAAHRRRQPLADVPPHHAAAAAAVAGAGADPVRHRLAARLRPVLHPDQGRAGQQHGHGRPAHLPRGVPAPEPGHRRGHLDRRAGGAAGPQRVQFRGLRVRPEPDAMTRDAHRARFARTPVLRPHRRARDHLPVPARSGAAVASVSPQAGTGAGDRLGLGNYTTLLDYGAGLPQYFAQQRVRLGAHGGASRWPSRCSAAMRSPGSRFPGKNVLFLLTLAILMVPYATLLIPLYVLLNALGLQNSLVGLALVLTMFQLPFAMFMMRISFEAVPAGARGGRARRRLRHVRRPAADPAAGGRARAHHGRPVRLPGRLERLHRAADPASTTPTRRRCRWPSPTCASRRWASSTTAPPRPASS